MRCFKFKLRHDLPRTTTRESYKAISQWLRLSARKVDESIDWEMVHKRFRDCMLYGTSQITSTDILKEQT